jgi:hypothetical protein
MISFPKLYEGIQDLLALGWNEGTEQDGGTFSLIYEPLANALSLTHGAIILQLYIRDRSSHRLDFEIEGNRDAMGNLAKELREFLIDGQQPEEIKGSRANAQTKIVYVKLPDSEKEQVAMLRVFIKYLSSKLSSYQSNSGAITPAPTSLESSISRMVEAPKKTAKQSGNESVTVQKYKEVRFETDEDFEKYLAQLHEAQAGLCALSGLPLQACEKGNLYSMSPDRIDSNGHYEPGNLQMVCRFINLWKSDTDNEQFKQLLDAVRAASDTTNQL